MVDSISPSSSASNDQVSPAGFDCLVKALEALQLVKDASPSERVRLADRVLSAYFAGLRGQGGSVGSGSPQSSCEHSLVSERPVRSFTSSSGGSAARRFKGVKEGVGAGRRSLVKVPVALTVARAVESTEGYCYLKAFRRSSWPEVKKDLGSYPNLFAMMSQSVDRYLPVEDLEKLGFAQQDGLGHLVDAASSEHNLLQVLRSVATTSRMSTRPDSIFHTLVAAGTSSLGYSATCKLGATVPKATRVVADVRAALLGREIEADWVVVQPRFESTAYLAISASEMGRVVKCCIPVDEEVDIRSFADVIGAPLTLVRPVGQHIGGRVASYSDGSLVFNVAYVRCASDSTSALLDRIGSKVVMDVIVTGRRGVHLQGKAVDFDRQTDDQVVVWRAAEDPYWLETSRR